MNVKLIEKYFTILDLIRIFGGSIRHEYLQTIIIKTKYDKRETKSSCSKLFSKLKKEGILNESTDFDGKKRFYLNKPVWAFLRGVEPSKTSSVADDKAARIKSNFKACYFIENYIYKYKFLSLEDHYYLVIYNRGNLFCDLKDDNFLRLIEEVESLLKEQSFNLFFYEYLERNSLHKKQLECLKKGPSARKEMLKAKNNGVDVYEEFNGTPIPRKIVIQDKTKTKQEVITLERLKKNGVYLENVALTDAIVEQFYASSVNLKIGGRTDFQTKFENLDTQQLTLKFVYFCSSPNLKTSKMKSIYEMIQSYANLFDFKDIITPTKQKAEILYKDLLNKHGERGVPKIMSEIPFDSPQIVKVKVEIDVIFMNKVNYKRSIKKILKHKDLKSITNPINYTTSYDFIINFKHYEFYSMNEHDPT
ncbi:hypothetical protein [Turicibacter sp.]|uniref:hypothetical protein n=1 Tax=Turicibacter sp. TaxID=2049042 RepID=UPI001B58BD12|nr:hypothetical protein [Turicibacter sp.]MBP3903574.1 hypothetical protein [Turicibacter sp.]MBP3908083.1 hypothetical protein [Turicibacter sp.]